MPTKLPDSNYLVNGSYNLEIADSANDNGRMDNEETLNRRARFRELLRECFSDSRKALAEHIKSRGHEPNLTELSNLKKDHGPRSFADKKAGMLAHEIGLNRRWFDMPLGSNLEKSHWMDNLLPSSNTKLPVVSAKSEPSNIEQAPALRGKVPLISFVQAGEFSEVIDNLQPGDGEEWIDATCPVNRYTFALRVVGDSMEPDFPAGTILIVEPDLSPEQNDYVIAKNGDGEATFKQLTRDGADWYLKPLNSRYPIKPLGTSRIIGVVRDAVRKFR